MRTVAFSVAALALTVGPTATAGDLYGIDIGPDTLLTINRDTAEVTPVGPVGIDPLNGLAYDADSGTMYALQPNDGLYRVDITTGQSKFIGSFDLPDFANVNGLAFDPIDDILYATDNNSNALLILDPTTGSATTVGAITGGFTEIEGLGYDARDRILYGITALERRIVTIDVTTAAAAPIPGPQLPGEGWRGLEFDPERRILFASAGNRLHAVDPATGVATLVGTMQVAFVQGLAFVPTCYADFTGDGTLDLFDFLAFQNAFFITDLSADCDHNETFDFFDFLCYTNSFEAGCD
jgi:hypothetical protein